MHASFGTVYDVITTVGGADSLTFYSSQTLEPYLRVLLSHVPTPTSSLRTIERSVQSLLSLRVLTFHFCLPFWTFFCTGYKARGLSLQSRLLYKRRGEGSTSKTISPTQKALDRRLRGFENNIIRHCLNDPYFEFSVVKYT